MNLPDFWYGSCSYGSLWENHTLYAGKILIWRIFGHEIAKFCPFKANFRVLAYKFQTPLWILLIFGSPDVFRLRKEPINSLSFVRTSVRPCVRSGPTALTVRYFFLIFWLRWPPKIFSVEKFFDPQNGQKWSKFGHFLAKIAIFENFWPISSKRRYKFS